MTRSELHLFVTAPEIIVVDLAVAALGSLERAIRAEHPAIHRRRCRGDPVRDRARHLLALARLLRHDLVAYRQAVLTLVRDLHRDDLPF